MGTKTTVTTFDDLDGSTDDVRTISLSFDGRSVELDLGEANYDKLAKAVEPYLKAGRKTGRSGGRRRTEQARSAGTDTAVIREWAAENGVAVSPRGRISASVRERFEAAQK